jgi:hypothetical protein
MRSTRPSSVISVSRWAPDRRRSSVVDNGSVHNLECGRWLSGSGKVFLLMEGAMSHQGRARVTLATIVSVLALSEGLVLAQAKAQATTSQSKKAPGSLRLYIFDCGTIHTTSVDAYSLKTDEVGSTEMSIPCIMVAHPRGTLMWDNGDIPDRAFKPGGGPASAGVVTQAAPLLPQLAITSPTPMHSLAPPGWYGRWSETGCSPMCRFPARTLPTTTC